MGFYWHVHMQVAFVQPVNIPANLSWWHTLERLKEFDGGGTRSGTLFSAAARALPDGSAVPETVAKRARTARSVMAIKGEESGAGSDEDQGWDDGDFEILYNEKQSFNDAATAAVQKILGDDSGISLVLMHASCDGTEGTELLLIHTPTVVTPPGSGGAGGGRGETNVSWGITMSALPSGEPPQAVEQIRRVLRALGMEPKGEPGWRLITSASGG